MKAHYTEPLVPEGAMPYENCKFEIDKLPYDCFMLTGDGAKGVELCRKRKAILEKLAGYADPDGTSCYPSIETLATKLSLCPRSLNRYLSDLVKLQFLVNGGYAYEGGPRVRRLIQPDCDKFFANLDARLNRERTIQKQERQIEKQDGKIPNQERIIEKQEGTHECAQPASINLPEEDLPVYNPPSLQPDGGMDGSEPAPSIQNRGQGESGNQKPTLETLDLWTALSVKYTVIRDMLGRHKCKPLPVALNKSGLPALRKVIADHEYTQKRIVSVFERWLINKFEESIGTSHEIKSPLSVFAADAPALVIELLRDEAEDAAEDAKEPQPVPAI